MPISPDILPLIEWESIFLSYPIQEMDSPCHIRQQETIVISSSPYGVISSASCAIISAR